MGGRLRAERERLRIAPRDAARLMGWQESFLAKAEASLSEGTFALGLKLFAHAGADVLYIVTGTRNQVGRAEGRAPGDQIRHGLENLAGVDRQRLLLHFVSVELDHLLSAR